MTRPGPSGTRWHDAYDDPESDLSQRLIAVQRRLGDAIDAAPPGEVRVISACAGQGHDVTGVLRTHPRAADVRALLVESDPHNVGVARARVAAEDIAGVDVLQADAGFTGSLSRRGTCARADAVRDIRECERCRSPQDRAKRVETLRAWRLGAVDPTPARTRSNSGDPGVVRRGRLCRGRIRLARA